MLKRQGAASSGLVIALRCCCYVLRWRAPQSARLRGLPPIQ